MTRWKSEENLIKKSTMDEVFDLFYNNPFNYLKLHELTQENDFNVDYQNPSSGNTIAHLTVCREDPELLKYILSFDPDLEIKNDFGKTVTEIASGWNIPSQINILMQYINSNLTIEDNNSNLSEEVESNLTEPLFILTKSNNEVIKSDKLFQMSLGRFDDIINKERLIESQESGNYKIEITFNPNLESYTLKKYCRDNKGDVIRLNRFIDKMALIREYNKEIKDMEELFYE